MSCGQTTTTRTPATAAKRDYITVAEAYRSTHTHAICMYHYEHSDAVAYSIGPVRSARSPGYCETCDAEVTDEQIEALMIEAGATGDHLMVYRCKQALIGSVAARADCAEAVSDARSPGHCETCDTLVCIDCNGRCNGDGCGATNHVGTANHVGCIASAQSDAADHACVDCGTYVCGPCTLDGGLCSECDADAEETR